MAESGAGLTPLPGEDPSEPSDWFSVDAPPGGIGVAAAGINLLPVSFEVWIARCCVSTAVDGAGSGWSVGVAGSELFGEVVRIGAICGFGNLASIDGVACPCRFAEPGG